MNTDLKSYVKIYSNWVDKISCKQIVNDLEKTDWGKHCFYINATNEFKSYDTDLDVTNNLPQWTEKVHGRIWSAIEQYLVKDFDFPWYKGWNGFNAVRYNRYKVGTEMRLHCDHIHSIFDGNRKGVPILTVLGGLNNDYEGGNLVMWENEIIELKEGDIMVFPSNFLYPHKIMPVTKGVRYSYVSWVW